MIERIAKRLRVSKKEASEYLLAYIQEGEKVLDSEGKLVLDEVGTLKKRDRKARIGRNPQTGEPVSIPAKTVEVFNAAPKMKAALTRMIAPAIAAAKKEWNKIAPTLKAEAAAAVAADSGTEGETVSAPPEPFSSVEAGAESDKMAASTEPKKEGMPAHEENPGGEMTTELKQLEKRLSFLILVIGIFLFVFALVTPLLWMSNDFATQSISKKVRESALGDFENKYNVAALEEEIGRLEDEVNALKAKSGKVVIDSTAIEERVKRKVLAELRSVRPKVSRAMGDPVLTIIKYMVKKGDSLWSISKKFSKNPFNWVGIYQNNGVKIRNPDRIYPGQTLLIPVFR